MLVAATSKRHVVLGAAGGTGSAVVRELAARGLRVRAVTRRGTGDDVVWPTIDEVLLDRDLPPAKDKDAKLARIDERVDELSTDLKKRELKRERDELERRLREVDAAANAAKN